MSELEQEASATNGKQGEEKVNSAEGGATDTKTAAEDTNGASTPHIGEKNGGDASVKATEDGVTEEGDKGAANGAKQGVDAGGGEEIATVEGRKAQYIAAAKAVEEDLGLAARKHYDAAYALVTKSPTLERLETATERLVKALQGAPEERSGSRGYGELALLYGRALLGFVIRGAAEGDVLGGKGGGEEKEGEDETKEDAKEEAEESVEELCWTQLEVARVAFKKCGAVERVCDATRTLGEFLLACDQATAAGAEFAAAARLCARRDRAECLYKQYLSLRRVDLDGARGALEAAVGELGAVGGAEDVVAEMRGELAALPRTEQARKRGAAEVAVTRVTPKRRK